ETIEVSAGAMIVNGNDGVIVGLDHSADGVHHPLLHFRVRPLHRIELNGVGIFAGGNGRYCATAHADAVVVATQHDNPVACRKPTFDAIFLARKSDAARQHDNFIIAIGAATV